ncbi:MAG: hypothetical protein HC893_08595 [Chloroflexaceae bacterium]|nr:hypothetical protein [Chloroflexaceae bacterium]NJO05811.1 hypothetical protein [Chloroflexaceae bacterium]NJO83324.1 hypothetical protein [Blastochloris sp.]
MPKPYEQITIGCLNGGFLSVEIAWHSLLYDKAVPIPPGYLIQGAGVLWAVALGLALWHSRALILQYQPPQRSAPWYFWLLSMVLCGGVFVMPWFLLLLLSLIRNPF